MTNYLGNETWSIEKSCACYILVHSSDPCCLLCKAFIMNFLPLEVCTYGSPFKNNGERNVTMISIFYGDLIQSHQALKVQMENTTTVKFQGTLHPNDGRNLLVFFSV